jgi:hypothetical protein
MLCRSPVCDHPGVTADTRPGGISLVQWGALKLAEGDAFTPLIISRP